MANKQEGLSVWEALGKWSIEICRPDAELSPPQYLIDAIKALESAPKAEPVAWMYFGTTFTRPVFAAKRWDNPGEYTETPLYAAAPINAGVCIWEDCDQDAIYCAGHAREFVDPLGRLSAPINAIPDVPHKEPTEPPK